MIRHRLIRQGTPCDKHEVIALLEMRMHPPYRFTKPALHPVATHRLPDSPPDRESVPVMREPVRCDAQNDESATHGPTTAPHLFEIAGTAETQPPRDHENA